MFLRVFLDLDFLYNLGIMIISWIAYFNQFFYVVLLLDALKRSRYLTQLLTSLFRHMLVILQILFFSCILLMTLIQDYYLQFEQNESIPTEGHLFDYITYFLSTILRDINRPSLFYS